MPDAALGQAVDLLQRRYPLPNQVMRRWAPETCPSCEEELAHCYGYQWRRSQQLNLFDAPGVRLPERAEFASCSDHPLILWPVPGAEPVDLIAPGFPSPHDL